VLYLGRRPESFIEGMDRGESDELLDALWDHCRRSEFVASHVWQLGDLVMWDNRCTMHRRDGFDENARRVMHRATLAGTIPVAA
jgi:taurine dioxygenase